MVEDVTVAWSPELFLLPMQSEMASSCWSGPKRSLRSFCQQPKPAYASLRRSAMRRTSVGFDEDTGWTLHDNAVGGFGS